MCDSLKKIISLSGLVRTILMGWLDWFLNIITVSEISLQRPWVNFVLIYLTTNLNWATPFSVRQNGLCSFFDPTFETSFLQPGWCGQKAKRRQMWGTLEREISRLKIKPQKVKSQPEESDGNSFPYDFQKNNTLDIHAHVAIGSNQGRLWPHCLLTQLLKGTAKSDFLFGSRVGRICSKSFNLIAKLRWLEMNAFFK